MSERICLHCGVDITDTHRNQKYCGAACRDARKWRERERAACSICGGPTGYPASRTPESPTCNPCRRADWDHGTRKGYREAGCRCDPCRDWYRSEMKSYAESRRQSGRPLIRRVRFTRRTCERCRASFETRADGRSRFCSVSCSKRRSRELVHVGPKVVVAPPVPVTIVSAPKWWAVIVQGPCAWCGEQFTATGSTTLYCSIRCSRAVSKSRRGRFTIPPRVRRAIYERDDWTCQLCMEPVERDADPLSDWFPSLDHIEPQSFVLLPDHSPSNLRTAHRWCNAVRGVGGVHDDLFEEVA